MGRLEARRCFCEGCDRSLEAASCQVCRQCGLALFCGPACRAASRLGSHAGCYLGQVRLPAPFPADTALYLIALLACGRHWQHRLRALQFLGMHLGARGRGPAAMDLYTPSREEVRRLLGSGLAPALSLFTQQLAAAAAGRLTFPPEWLDPEDPLAAWGLGAAAMRVVRLLTCLTTPKPPGLAGWEWPPGELRRVCGQLEGGPADKEAPSGGFCGALVELAINLAPTFPRPGRAVALEAATALHALACRAPCPRLAASAAAALGSRLRPPGLHALLAPPPRPTAPDPEEEAMARAMAAMSGAGGGGAGEEGPEEQETRREVAITCTLRLLAGCPHGPEVKEALTKEWQYAWQYVSDTLAPAMKAAAAATAAGLGGDAHLERRAAAWGGGGSEAAPPAAAAGLLRAYVDLLDECRTQKSLPNKEVVDSVTLLTFIVGAMPGAPGARGPPPPPPSGAAGALRGAALEALCGRGGLLGLDQLLRVLPHVTSGPSLPPTSPGAAACALVYAPAAPGRVLSPRGAALAASWLASRPPAPFPPPGSPRADGPGLGRRFGEALQTAPNCVEAAEKVARRLGPACTGAFVYGSLCDLAWGALAQLEESLRVAPGCSASAAFAGTEAAVAVLRAAARLAEHGLPIGARVADQLAKAGAHPALARCLLLRRPDAARAAAEALAAALCAVDVEPEAERDPSGSVCFATTLLARELVKEQRTVVRQPHSTGTAAGGASSSYGYASGRALEALAALAVDPAKATEGASRGEEGAAGAAAAADEEDRVAAQIAALRAIAALLATADPGTALRLLAAPGLAPGIAAAAQEAAAALAAAATQGSAAAGAAAPASSASSSAAAAAAPSTAPGPNHTRLWWARMVVLCGVAVAVPRWLRERARGRGVLAAGAGAAAGPSTSTGAGGGKKQGKKKGGAGGGGGAREAEVSGLSGADLTVAQMGLASAGAILGMAAPGQPLTAPGVDVRRIVAAADPALYGILLAADPQPLAVITDPAVRAERLRQVEGLMDELGWRGAAALALLAAAANDPNAPPEVTAAVSAGLQAAVVAAGSGITVEQALAQARQAAAAEGQAGGSAAASTSAAAGEGGGESGKRCAVCGKSASSPGVRKLHKCGGCKAVRYCSRECQAADWPEHQSQCKRLAAEAAEAE
ncbi:hypothetical protein HYH03_009903 [Edaphochlamys debaryana]|uniref:MYND-type domain-containing protein n=1 Tax=Edaphochlamys debaryana TaxID=47281 RepID=A0A836BWQ1_9CHLO|nr:hypothetical protein HYH03_009903 [Edaphochlamys debaryana]|eukprot:KAG2491740.1 hypothetical protein HYH03_009903 [Edaphochlamys debaryana]